MLGDGILWYFSLPNPFLLTVMCLNPILIMHDFFHSQKPPTGSIQVLPQLKEENSSPKEEEEGEESFMSFIYKLYA